MDIITNYLLSEKFLGLSAGIVGCVSILLGFCFIFFLPQFKAFALTMIIIGIIEASLFIPAYYLNDSQYHSKVATYINEPEKYVKQQITVAQKALESFFLLKVMYSCFILFLVIVISKYNITAVYIGVFTALIIHLTLAITIDNFGEQYTKKYHRALLNESEAIK